MEWKLTAVYKSGKVMTQQFDADEIGTLDDVLTHFFLTDLAEIEAIKITRTRKE
jgi:hypothetical protein